MYKIVYSDGIVDSIENFEFTENPNFVKIWEIDNEHYLLVNSLQIKCIYKED